MVYNVFFGGALRGRPEPRGQHKRIYQQELTGLRFRDSTQSVRLPKRDMATRPEDETVRFSNFGASRTDDRSRGVWYNCYLSRGFRGPVERPEVSHWN
jgi:hypothetical protein